MNHIVSPNKKALSPEQIKMFAEMYAEMTALKYVNSWGDGYGRFLSDNGLVDINFNDLNIVMEIAAWWTRGSSERRFALSITEVGYQANAIDMLLKKHPIVQTGKGIEPQIAIAEALQKIRDKS